MGFILTGAPSENRRSSSVEDQFGMGAAVRDYSDHLKVYMHSPFEAFEVRTLNRFMSLIALAFLHEAEGRMRGGRIRSAIPDDSTVLFLRPRERDRSGTREQHGISPQLHS